MPCLPSRSCTKALSVALAVHFSEPEKLNKEKVFDKGQYIVRKIKGSIFLMYLKNIEEGSCQKGCVINNFGLKNHIFLVFNGFFCHVQQF